jgi:hypothetical protein
MVEVVLDDGARFGQIVSGGPDHDLDPAMQSTHGQCLKVRRQARQAMRLALCEPVRFF